MEKPLQKNMRPASWVLKKAGGKETLCNNHYGESKAFLHLKMGWKRANCSTAFQASHERKLHLSNIFSNIELD